MCHKSGLNIGIAVGIWSIDPFLVSVMERIFEGTTLTCSQFVGMFALFIMAVLISLSDVINPPEEGLSIEKEHDTPVYLAVLSSFIIPIIFALGCFLIKYTDQTLKLDAYDFTFGYWFLMSVVLLVAQIVHAVKDEESRVSKYWISGFLGSLFGLIGVAFFISALSSNPKYMGPTSALV